MQRAEHVERVTRGVRPRGEQVLTHRQLDPALEVDPPQAYDVGADGWGEAAADAPQNRALAGA